MRRHELGFFVPPSVQADAEPALSHVGTYLTYSEVTDREPIPQSEIIARVERMSAADCFLALSQIGTRCSPAATGESRVAFKTR
jgi:hypothetical protein